MKNIIIILLLTISKLSYSQKLFDITVSGGVMNIQGVTDTSFSRSSSIFSYSDWAGIQVKFTGFGNSDLYFDTEQFNEINGDAVTQPITVPDFITLLDTYAQAVGDSTLFATQYQVDTAKANIYAAIGSGGGGSDTNALTTNTPLSTTLDTIQRNGLSSSTFIGTNQLQQRNNGLGVTQDTTKGITLANYTPAAAGVQQISPALQFVGQGWATGVNNSQTVRFHSYVLPVQAGTNPTATWVLQSSINNGSFGNGLTYTSSGNLTTAGSTTSSSFSSNSNIAAATQYILNSSSVSSQQHRTTNGGANVQPLIAVNNGTTAGNLSIAYETTNQLTFDAANGTRQIARAGIGIRNLVNTAGSESGNLAFSTQDAGAAMAERVRITNTGNLLINTTTDVPSSKLTINSTTQGFLPPRMTAAQAGAIASPAEGLLIYVTDTDGTFTSPGWWGYSNMWEKLNN